MPAGLLGLLPTLAEIESLAPHEGAEIGALRPGILPRLVLRPAVEFRRAEFGRMALSPIGLRGGAAFAARVLRSLGHETRVACPRVPP